MRAPALTFVAFYLGCSILAAAEVELGAPKPTPTASRLAPFAKPDAALPKYRPALLGIGPASVINRIDTQKLMLAGQKDASLMFCCSVLKTGAIEEAWVYSQSPGSDALEEELNRCLDTAGFVPAIYNHQVVDALFYGTVTFKIVNEKPRLRIFANQEAEELNNENDFVGPQPFIGRDSKFEGLHYPDSLTNVLTGLVELCAQIDADGNLKDLKLFSEHPPLAGFGRAAAEDFRVARFIPAFREGKPVGCTITLPVYYQPHDQP